MFDSHVHTTFSTDSKMTINEAIDASVKNNVGIIITEHLDLNFMRANEYDFDIKKYFKQYEKYVSDRLLLGVEMGMRPDCIKENKSMAENYNFNYIIGSVHVVENKGEYLDIYTGEFYNDRSKTEVYRNYLNYMLQCVKEYDFIDSLGHIDYISRYARFEDKEIYYEEFKDIIDEILKELVYKEKAMEINTRRFNDQEAIKNLLHIYKRFKEFGGEIVTLGSDSHRPQNIGNHFKIAQEFAMECGLKPVYFKNRKPMFMD